jgi:hypothetical protein
MGAVIIEGDTPMNRLVPAAACALAVVLAVGAGHAQPAAAPGIGTAVTGLIEKACLPLIKGQDVKTVAQAAGLKRSRDDLVLQLPGVERIILSPPTTQNPTVCSMEVSYEAGQTKPLVDVLTAWAASQDPPIPVLATASTTASGETSWSWALDTGQMQEGLVFNARRSAEGKSNGKNFELGTVLFSRSGA